MTNKEPTTQTGSLLFEAFVEQIRQILEHLYDFAYLQKHPLAQSSDNPASLSTRTAGRQLRYEVITAIESLKSKPDVHFRAPDARLYNLLHLMYVENLTIQEVAIELGLSERQAYRDLKRGQEAVAAILWNSRLSSTEAIREVSLRSEMAHLRLDFSPIEVSTVFQQARKVVERLAMQQSVEIVVKAEHELLPLLSDPSLAHQMMVSILSYAIQQAHPGTLAVAIEGEQNAVTLTLRYPARDEIAASAETQAMLVELTQRLHWTISYRDIPGFHEMNLRLISHRATILVIDDNEGWMTLVERFLVGFDFMVVTLRGSKDILQRIQELSPSAIILDVMMPETDGWEILQRLRAQTITANIPVIVCSVFNDPQLAYSLGASVFIPKTNDLEQILEALRELSIF